MRRIALFKYIGEPYNYIGFSASVNDGHSVNAERKYEDRVKVIRRPKKFLYKPVEDSRKSIEI